MENKVSLEDKLMRLLSVPSVSYHEENILEEISFYLSSSLNFSEIYSAGNNNLVCFLHPEKEKSAKKIALVGHLDTVPYANDAQRKPAIKDGTIYGRGAADMKAGLACMLHIAEEISLGSESDYAITLVFYSREEKHLPNGINEVLDSGKLKSTDAAIVLEPTDRTYALGNLGSITADIFFRGKAAHSSQPDRGVNAIYQSLDFLINMQKKLAGVNNQILYGMPCKEYINVTGISTDNAHNIIPPASKLNVNYRFSPVSNDEAALSVFKRLIGEDTEFKLRDLSPSYIIDEQKFPIKLLEKNEKKILHAWADASQLARAGIPSIVFGPGKIAYAHADDEQIDIKELGGFYQDLRLMLLKN